VLPLIDGNRTIVAVTADHSTSCVRKAHTAEPVPLLVTGGPVQPDGSDSFGERACAAGSLGQLRGIDIVPRLAALMRS
jgi:2,3-bisphosphoglycerate-independent phosphoglycerate mutase